MIILEENSKWHLEAFASELFILLLFYLLSMRWAAKLVFQMQLWL